jgi:hypothetical protein
MKILYNQRQAELLESGYEDPSIFEDAEDSIDSRFKISCLIFSTKSPQPIDGHVYNYDDHIISDKMIIYQGQKKGSRDHLIKENETLYLYRNKSNDKFFIYGGLVTKKKKIHENTGEGVTYELEINDKYIHSNIEPGRVLKKMDEFSGVGCIKKSSIKHLNLSECDKGYMQGIMPVS